MPLSETALTPASVESFSDVLVWLGSRPAFSVVQLGAHTGDTVDDPLFGFLRQTLNALPPDRAAGTTVVLVEPVREYFDRLRDHCGQWPSVRLENAAVAESRGRRDFYRLAVDPEAHGHPAWMHELGSLRAERMTTLWDNHERNGEQQRFYLEHRVVESVVCVTLQDLLDRHAITALDLLQIDTEGYDYEILKTVDFTRTRPQFINYERVLLQHDEPACRAMLSDAGYRLIDWGIDTLAVRT